jgi:hypothetical protein
MKPENKALLVIIVAVVVVVGVVGTYLLVAVLPTTLSLPVYSLPLSEGPVSGRFFVHFDVVGGNAELVGAWYWPEGGAVFVRPANDTRPFFTAGCVQPWNGTISQSFVPGHYTMLFDQWGQGRIVITQTLRLVYPGSPNASSFYYEGSCGMGAGTG